MTTNDADRDHCNPQAGCANAHDQHHGSDDHERDSDPNQGRHDSSFPCSQARGLMRLGWTRSVMPAGAIGHVSAERTDSGLVGGPFRCGRRPPDDAFVEVADLALMNELNRHYGSVTKSQSTTSVTSCNSGSARFE